MYASELLSGINFNQECSKPNIRKEMNVDGNNMQTAILRNVNIVTLEQANQNIFKIDKAYKIILRKRYQEFLRNDI